MRDRRVLHGWLGCANCRSKWLVQDGFGEFRAPLGSAVMDAGEMTVAEADGDAAVRIAALLGVTEGPAFVLVAGPAARHAAAIADLIEDLEVIAADPALASLDERPGVNRIATGERLPFYSAKLRGVWLDGALADTLLEEGARVLWPLGRLVLDPAPQDAEERLAAAGMRVLARKDTTLLAAREP
jgi:hypothetical protein